MAFKPSTSCFYFRAPVLCLADRYDITPLFGAGLILLFYLNMIAACNLDLQNGERSLQTILMDAWTLAVILLPFLAQLLLCNDSRCWLTELTELVDFCCRREAANSKIESSSRWREHTNSQHKQFQSLQTQYHTSSWACSRASVWTWTVFMLLGFSWQCSQFIHLFLKYI